MYSKRTFPPLTTPCRQSQHCLQCKLVNQLADAVVHLFAIACHTNRAKSEIPSRKHSAGKSGLKVAVAQTATNKHPNHQLRNKSNNCCVQSRLPGLHRTGAFTQSAWSGSLCDTSKIRHVNYGLYTRRTKIPGIVCPDVPYDFHRDRVPTQTAVPTPWVS